MSGENNGEDDSKASGGAGDIIKAADTKLSLLIFGPSAKVVGGFLEENTKRLVDWFRGAKDETIKAHVSRVMEVVGEPQEVKVGQLIKIERWIRIAGEVPIEDAAKAAVVEAALAEIISTSNGGGGDYQDIADRITSAGAKVLLASPCDENLAANESDQLAFDQLKSLGLANTPGRRQFTKQAVAWLVGTLIGLAILFGVILRYAHGFLPQQFPLFLETEFVLEAVAISAVIIGLAISLLSRTYRLTGLGEALQLSAKRFYNRTDRKPPTVIPRRLWLVWGASAALIVCAVPFLLQAYLPRQFRFNTLPTTVIISSAPAGSASGTGDTSPPPSSQPPQSTPPTLTITKEQLTDLRDAWNGIDKQADGLISLVHDSQEFLKNWQQQIEKNPADAASKLLGWRDSLNQRRSSLQSLYTLYNGYPNVATTLEDVTKESGFTKLYTAFDTLAREARAVRLESRAGSPPVPEPFEQSLRPFVNDLTTQLKAMDAWANRTGKFAKLQSDELSAGLK